MIYFVLELNKFKEFIGEIILKKAVDVETKSNAVQSMLNGILFEKIDVGENFLIETPSFIVNHAKLLISSNSTNEIPFQNRNIFEIPSFCNLTNRKDCTGERVVLLKVKNNSSFIKRLISFTFTFKS